MVIRRNGVIDMTTAGSSAISVSDSAICIGKLSVVVFPVTVTFGKAGSEIRAAQEHDAASKPGKKQRTIFTGLLLKKLGQRQERFPTDCIRSETARSTASCRQAGSSARNAAASGPAGR